MKPSKQEAFDTPRRGRRKGQAQSDTSTVRSAKAHALIAALGEDLIDRQVELSDCLAVLKYCPDRSPERIPSELVNLAWRMLIALKKNDKAWFERRLAVRGGKAFQLLNAVGAPLEDFIEPDRAILAYLTEWQNAERQKTGTIRPISDQELSDYVAAQRSDDDDTPTPTTKTLGKKFLAMGGVKNRKRGPKARKS